MRERVRILVADDEADLLFVLKERLEQAGFLVETAEDGDAALEAIRRRPPDIAIIDLNMPRRDGFDVCRALRADPVFEHLPVILLSAEGTREHKVEGLDLGADDFISKPVDMPELLARVRTIVRRTRQDLDANPLTRLPGNVSIESHIKERLAGGLPLAVLYIDLNQFKAYNDAYGYDRGDQVIKATAALLLRLARREDPAGADFVGHIGGDDFIVITTPERMEALARRVIAQFDALAPSFYDAEDRRRGRVLSTDRQGKVQEFPLLSVAIGVCHNRRRRLASFAQVSQLASELKRHAKRRGGSAYEIDRRRE